MADGMNKVFLLGNLGADPELRFTQGGQAVLNIRLATTESYLDKDGERHERTDWHSVVVWGKRGEGLAKILATGDRILVEGGIRTSSYDDKEGNKKYKTEIHAVDIKLCGSKKSGGSDRDRDDDDRGRGRSDDRGGRDRDRGGRGRDDDDRGRDRGDRDRGRGDGGDRDRGRRDDRGSDRGSSRGGDDRRERSSDDRRESSKSDKGRRDSAPDNDDDIPF